MKMMKALIKKEARPGLWLGSVPIPTYGSNDVRIKITKTAICGTDLHIYNWDKWSQSRIAVPLVIGHEFCGIVEAIGSEVRGIEVGDRVSGEGHVTCGHCRNCRAGKHHLCRNTYGTGVDKQGVFAEYAVLPAFNTFKIPDNISDDLASIFDPYGNAVHTALSYDLIGEDLLITGAGPVGLMATAIARHVGARHIVTTDVNDYRLDLAKQMGATRTVNAKTDDLRAVMNELGMKEGFDVGLEMSGNADAFRSMLDTINYGGKVVLLGIFPEPVAIDWSLVIFKGLFLKGIYGREMFETWYKMASMLQSGLNIEPVITHRLHVDEFESGFRCMQEGKSGKVILSWGS